MSLRTLLVGYTIAVVAITGFLSYADASQCEIIGDKLTCFGNIGVTQEGLDEDDINTLWSIAQAKARGTYSGNMANMVEEKPQTYPFKGLAVTEEMKQAQNDKARNVICEHTLYHANFKKQSGCVMNNDGTWSLNQYENLR